MVLEDRATLPKLLTSRTQKVSPLHLYTQKQLYRRTCILIRVYISIYIDKYLDEYINKYTFLDTFEYVCIHIMYV